MACSFSGGVTVCADNPIFEQGVRMIAADLLSIFRKSDFIYKKQKDKIFTDKELRYIFTIRANANKSAYAFIVDFVKSALQTGVVNYKPGYTNDKRILSIYLNCGSGGYSFDTGISPMVPAYANNLSMVKNKGIAAAIGSLIGFLGHEGGLLRKEARDQIKEDFNAVMQANNNSFVVPVLERGMKFYRVNISDNAETLNKTEEKIKKDICAAIGVPALFLGLDNTQNYNVALSMYEQTIRSWTHVFEDFIYSVCKKQINLSDSAAAVLVRFKADTLLNAGALTRNEYRALFGLPSVSGGDVLTVQAAQIPIEDVGKNFINGG